MQAALPLVSYDPADPTVLEMSAADGDARWSLWQVPLGESQCMPLGPGATAWPFSVNNCASFEKQPLACYWALETD